MQSVLADVAIGFDELTKNPTAIFKDALDGPVAVTNDDRVTAYIVAADLFESMMQRLDDFELAERVRARGAEVAVPVSLEDL